MPSNGRARPRLCSLALGLLHYSFFSGLSSSRTATGGLVAGNGMDDWRGWRCGLRHRYRFELDRGRNPDRRAGWRNWRTQLLEDIERHVGIDRPRWNDDRNVFLQRTDGDMRPAEWAEVQQDQLGVLELEEVRRALNQLDPKGRAHRGGDGVRATGASGEEGGVRRASST